MAKKKNHYVNNKTLYEAIIEYHEFLKQVKKEKKPLPQIPKYIGQAIMQICTNLALMPNFYNYSFKDEMIADAIENCVAAVDKFDPAKSKNPFAYFTQIAFHAFIRRIYKESKQSYIKAKNVERFVLMGEMVAVSSEDSPYSVEKSHELIRKFEEKLTRKPKRGKKEKKERV